MEPVFDRTLEDIGNILHLEHVNVRQPDQQLAALFYVVGLGLTRDPYMMVGVDNMWINIGRNQLHLPTGHAQRLRGTIGLVVPDLEALMQRLSGVASLLSHTHFGFTGRHTFLEVTCPWGNRFRCHAPAQEFGPTELGIAYVEFTAAPGTAARIVRFYREIIGAQAAVVRRDGPAAGGAVAGET